MLFFFFSNMSFMFYEGLVLRVDSRKTRKKTIFLFFHDFDDVVVFSRAGCG